MVIQVDDERVEDQMTNDLEQRRHLEICAGKLGSPIGYQVRWRAK